MPSKDGHPGGGEPSDAPLPDEELLAGYLAGDDQQFAELVARYERPLCDFICRTVPDRTDAEDLFQETFIQVSLKADSFGGHSSFKTWLYAIAINVCRAYMRKNLRRGRLDPSRLRRPSEGDSRDPATIAEDSEIGARVSRAVSSLPPKQRGVVVMKLHAGLTFSQIAATLGVRLATVKSRMRLALRKIRPAFQDIARDRGMLPEGEDAVGDGKGV